MMESFSKKLEALIDSGWNCEHLDHYFNWGSRVMAFLRTAIDDETADTFKRYYERDADWPYSRDQQIGFLEGLAFRVEQRGVVEERSLHANLKRSRKTKKVFVVHGKDDQAKLDSARFLEKIGLEPVILHEQPNLGKTIIEKFEAYADVGFAVVLLTPDDKVVGGDGDQFRARQNVILELGYFMGRLGRNRVCALYKQGVEIPSDYQGVLYVELDKNGGWRTKLAQELVEAEFAIDISGILKS